MTGQHPEWKDIANHSPTYRRYWAQWKSVTVRNGVLRVEHHWESADGQSKIAQIILPQSRVNSVLNELHGRPSGGPLGVNKTLSKVQQRYSWLPVRNDVEKWCQHCDTFAPHPSTHSRGTPKEGCRIPSWDTRLPIFLMAYRAFTHATMVLTPASLVFRREL